MEDNRNIRLFSCMVIVINFIFGLWIGSIVTIIIMALLEAGSDVVNNKPKVNPELRADLLRRYM